MSISKKQRLLMVAIVVVGVIAGAGVMLTSRKSAEPAPAAKEETSPAKPVAAKEREPKAPAKSDSHDDEKAGQAEDKSHGDDAGHDEKREFKLTEEQVKSAGIVVTPLGPVKIQTRSNLPGEIRFNEDRTAHVVPRVAGVVEAVPANLGQQVKRGEVMAAISSTTLSDQRSELATAQRRREAARVTFDREKKLWEEKISAEADYLAAQTTLREADIAVTNAQQKLAAIGASSSAAQLNRFEIRAPFDGTVVEKHLTLGEAVTEATSAFTVADLSTVWAEIVVAPKDLAIVRVGQRVEVTSTAFAEKVDGTISYVGSLLGEQTRTARARVTLQNPRGAWRPGLFVTVSVLGAEEDVSLGVPSDAIQMIDERPTLFKAIEGGFEAIEVKVGRTDGKTSEILDGLKPGDRVATRNTFVLKSELGKSGASHDH